MAKPWGRGGCRSRISWTWLTLTGSGCLFLFLFPPLGLFLLALSVWTQFLLGKSVAGVCPYCREDTATSKGKTHGMEFPCVHCEKTLYIDRSSGTPVFVKEQPESLEGTALPKARPAPLPGRPGMAPDAALKKKRLRVIFLAGLGVVFAFSVFSWQARSLRNKALSRGKAGIVQKKPVRNGPASGAQAPAARSAAALPAAAASPAVSGGERILSFHSDVTVHPEGSLEVRETITVRAEGRKIKRGIYRDFPTRYQDRYGYHYNVTFKVLSVERDGLTEPWHQEKRGNGVRVYIGNKNYFLPHDVYSYTLTYRTIGQLGFFDEYDELYWNVTGNGWEFPIDEASCAVTLPPGVPRDQLRLAGYTGVSGSGETAVAHSVDPAGGVAFRATRPLGTREGLTVAVGWPKGFVTEPSRADRLGSFMASNMHLWVLIIGTAVLCLYYLVAWHRVGRDPEKDAFVPLFEPPRKLSPSALRYIRRMGFDTKAFAAAVIDMAVKGYLEIRESPGFFSKGFVLIKKEGADAASLFKGQKLLAGKFFPGSVDTLILQKKNYRTVGGALKVLKKSLESEYQGAIFKLNSRHLFPGALISAATVAIMAVTHQSLPKDAAGMMLWLGVWTMAVVLLWAKRVYVMAVIFTLAEIGAIAGFTSSGFPLTFFAAFLILAGINLLFYFLLKAPTHYGRRLMDEIEGFRMYLAAAEGDRLRVMNPPEKTPELFERYLPYALALDVDNEWAEQFAEVLARAGVDSSPGGYRPSWYHGSRWNSSSLGSFAGGLGSSLSSAISSSSTAPGSSSGSGGGGSSGGGGGGGGGGGW